MFAHQGHAAGAVVRARRLRSAMTPSERRLWKGLKALGVHVRRQAPIGPYIADFVCHSRKLVIEVDGEIHERLDELVLRDHERSEWLRGEGYRVFRVTNREVDADVTTVVAEIARHLALPLDGEGLGWGAAAAAVSEPGSAPNRALRPSAMPTPQSPALSPSRGKGE